MEKEELIEILKNNRENIDKGNWNAVYECMDEYDRGEFSAFLLENDIDPSTLFKKEIPEFAFLDCTSLTSITIPDSVTSIGEYAFSGCWKLTSITIPDSVTSIDKCAFFHCNSLTSITLPNSIKKISEDTFGDCSALKSITIPKGVTEIDLIAFYSCYSLTSITIPNSITYIANNAFANCSSLTEIKYDGTEEEWKLSNIRFDFIRRCPVNRKKHKITFLK